MDQSVKCGYLVKQGGSWKSWKKRWCMLTPTGMIFYFKDKKDINSKGCVDVNSASDILAEDVKKKNCFGIVTPNRTYFMAAESKETRDDWIQCLKRFVKTPGNNNNTTSSNPQVGSNEEKKRMTVDDFEMLSLIGKGSFGKVMQVRMKETQQIYAMKILNKSHIIDNNEIEHTMAEKSVLAKSKNPFLMQMHFSFQTGDKLYFILDYVNGGELFAHLQREHRFSIERTRFYASELLIGLKYLHDAGIVYRDLKPENVLLTDDGHICITDFGLCKEGLSESDQTNTFCGTPEYLAPEILLGNGYGFAVDWWSYGTLIYEMLLGLPPFFDNDVQTMYQKIVSDDVRFPKNTPPSIRDFISSLLQKDPADRLTDPEVMKKHAFFKNMDFDMVLAKKIKPPFIPNVTSKEDLAMISEEFLVETEEAVAEEKVVVPRNEGVDFSGFTYVSQ
ncbi:non-specific serine/threonine protein kinase [Entamoeba marina]